MTIARVSATKMWRVDQGGGPATVNDGGTGLTVVSAADQVAVLKVNCYGPVVGASLTDSSGAAFSQVGSTVNGDYGGNVSLFVMPNPPAGGPYFPWINSSYTIASAIMELWSGVDTTTPVGTPASGVFSGVASSLNVTSPTGGVVIDAVVHNFDGITPGAGQTGLVDVTDSGFQRVLGTYKVGSGTVNMSWTDFMYGATIAVALNPAGAGGGTGWGSLIGGSLVRGALVGGSLVARRRFHKHSTGPYLPDRSNR